MTQKKQVSPDAEERTARDIPVESCRGHGSAEVWACVVREFSLFRDSLGSHLAAFRRPSRTRDRRHGCDVCAPKLGALLASISGVAAAGVSCDTEPSVVELAGARVGPTGSRLATQAPPPRRHLVDHSSPSSPVAGRLGEGATSCAQSAEGDRVSLYGTAVPLCGGAASSFRGLSETGELSIGVFWELRDLGLGEAAARRRRAGKSRRARRQVELAAANLADVQHSLDLNRSRVRAAEGLPLETLQATQAAAAAKSGGIQSVGEFNRAQFRLLRAVGRPIPPRPIP